ncbi:MAG: hypothetical protein WA197_23095 [Candidatus Acidiferrales bacterium]
MTPKPETESTEPALLYVHVDEFGVTGFDYPENPELREAAKQFAEKIQPLLKQFDASVKNPPKQAAKRRK